MSCGKTRSGTARKAPTPAGTAAGCRCRGPGRDPPFGFSPPGASQRALAAAAQRVAGTHGRGGVGQRRLDACTLPARAAASAGRVRARRRPDALAASPDGVLDFDRDAGVRCVANLSGEPVALPPTLRSCSRAARSTRGLLPPDTAVWLRIDVDGRARLVGPAPGGLTSLARRCPPRFLVLTGPPGRRPCAGRGR